MDNIIPFHNDAAEAKPEDYVEVSKGLWMLKCAERVGPGVFTNDPKIGAKEYNEHRATSLAPAERGPTVVEVLQEAVQFCLDNKGTPAARLITLIFLSETGNGPTLDLSTKNDLIRQLPSEHQQRILRVFLYQQYIESLVSPADIIRLSTSPIRLV